MKFWGQMEGQFWAAAAAGQPNLCGFKETHPHAHTHTEENYKFCSWELNLRPSWCEGNSASHYNQKVWECNQDSRVAACAGRSHWRSSPAGNAKVFAP